MTKEDSTTLRAVGGPEEARDRALGPAGAGALVESDLLETERFLLRRRLGSGGFGTVYEALDRDRNAVVALKTLHADRTRELYQFKQEFRAIAELRHPNLVQLYELHAEGSRWFFTMEILRGQRFDEHVRLLPDPHLFDPLSPISSGPVGSAEPGDESAPAFFDEAKLRRALRQLAEGLCFLHDAGRVHRDIKPSNILVAHDDRVVLLDFGLVIETSTQGEAQGEQSGSAVVGTPLFMAPEQFLGTGVGPASDWYAVGVMLYKALTGQYPFTGNLLDLASQKYTEDPPPPAKRASKLPEDLNQLCVDLLRRAPGERPEGREVLRRLTPEPVSAPLAPASARPRDFVGRERELAALHRAFAEARAGSTTVALLAGLSGMGKSSLASRFLSQLREAEPTLVLLAGRCFDQESVPYKALDSVVDVLSRYLKRLPPRDAAALLPRDAATLCRLFPALQRVEAMNAARGRPEQRNPSELRRRAFLALRELLGRIGEREPLVVFIDDLQWGDIDSAALLLELLRPPDPPAMLLVASYRADEAERSECLRELLPALRERAGEHLSLAEIAVGGLSDDEATEMFRGTLGQALAARVVREAAGSPMFLQELARHASAAPDQDFAGAELSLDGLLAARVDALPEAARRLLELVAVAGQPISRVVIAGAADLGDAELSVIGLLRQERMIRTRRGGRYEEVEACHDRIRQAVFERLSPEAKRAHHRRIARALSSSSHADAETLAVHFAGAGELDQAVEAMILAADQAMEAFSFDRAARLYQSALDAMAAVDARRRALYEKRGAALASAKRGFEAASAYLTAAQGASAEAALELRRKAAEGYLSSGHHREGLDVSREVLASTGIALPANPVLLIWRLVVVLLLLRLRGLRFEERADSDIAARDRLRLEACTAVSVGLTEYLPLLGFYVQKLSLRLALQAGDPRLLLRALTSEVSYLGMFGGTVPSRREEAIHRLARSLSARFPELAPRYEAYDGISLAFRWRFREARDRLARAAAALSAPGSGSYVEVGHAQLFHLVTLFWLGAFRELRELQAEILDDARSRGNASLEYMILSFTGCVPYLMADQLGAGRAMIERADTLVSSTNQFHAYHRMRLRSDLELYAEEGAGGQALARMASLWTELVRSRVTLLVPLIRVDCLRMHGLSRLAAAAAAPSPRREELLRLAEQDARALTRTGTAVGQAYARLVGAAVAAMRGLRAQALAGLERAEAAFDALGFAAVLQALRHRRGRLLGGDEGRVLVEASEAALRVEEVKNPARFATMLVPGTWEAPP